jgi:poly-beta-hydroxyalkanoate depolymerase
VAFQYFWECRLCETVACARHLERLGDMRELAAAARPSCGLRAFNRDGPSDPPALTVTPASGQQGTISDDLIEVLASDHDVEVTEWVDAQLVCARGGGVRS